MCPAACCLSLCAIWIVASMRITIVSPRSRSATRDGGIRPCRASINPHTCRRTLRSRGRDPFPLVRADLLQRPPQRRVRGHRPEQLGLIPQHRQVGQHPAAVGDQHRGVGQHPAPVVHRGEPAPAQRPGQRAGQPGPVGQQPQRRGPGVRHDSVPADFHGQIPGPRGKLVHLKGAPRSRQNVGFDTRILPGQGHLSLFRHTPRQDRYELPGLRGFRQRFLSSPLHQCLPDPSRLTVPTRPVLHRSATTDRR